MRRKYERKFNIKLKHIERFRKELGLTQEQFALKAEVSRATVNRIESIGIPVTASTAHKLAAALGKNYEDIVCVQSSKKLLVK